MSWTVNMSRVKINKDDLESYLKSGSKVDYAASTEEMYSADYNDYKKARAYFLFKYFYTVAYENSFEATGKSCIDDKNTYCRFDEFDCGSARIISNHTRYVKYDSKFANNITVYITNITLVRTTKDKAFEQKWDQYIRGKYSKSSLFHQVAEKYTPEGLGENELG